MITEIEIKKFKCFEDFKANEINDFKIDASLTNSNLFKEISSDKKSINFIPSSKIDNELIINLYDSIKENRKRDKLNQYISQFDPDILEFEIINNLPKVFLDSRKHFEDISNFTNCL